jgi:hypothetical protein
MEKYEMAKLVPWTEKERYVSSSIKYYSYAYYLKVMSLLLKTSPLNLQLCKKLTNIMRDGVKLIYLIITFHKYVSTREVKVPFPSCWRPNERFVAMVLSPQRFWAV